MCNDICKPKLTLTLNPYLTVDTSAFKTLPKTNRANKNEFRDTFDRAHCCLHLRETRYTDSYYIVLRVTISLEYSVSVVPKQRGAPILVRERQIILSIRCL